MNEPALSLAVRNFQTIVSLSKKVAAKIAIFRCQAAMEARARPTTAPATRLSFTITIPVDKTRTE